MSLKYERIESGTDAIHIGSRSGFKDLKNLCFKYRNSETNKIVALKTFKLLSEVSADGSSEEKEIGVPIAVLREMSLAKTIDHENISRLDGTHYINGESCLYAYFEYPGMDLTSFIEREPEKSGDPMLVKKLLRQILRGVSVYHSMNVPHGSLNSTNVLIDSEHDSVKLINLELFAKHPNIAPEILSGSTDPSLATDMFSVGCIYGEMVTKKPLFTGGENNLVQLRSIFKLLGTPTDENWPEVKELYPSLLEYEKMVPKELREVFPSLDEDGIDLISKMLSLDPSKRISAVDALKHPYFEDVEG